MYFVKNLTLSALVAAVKSTDIKVNTIDESTYSNLHQIASNHMVLNFTVDFDSKQFVGNVEHTLTCIESTDKVIMDYVGIDVSNI
jgi:hypothetical protein